MKVKFYSLLALILLTTKLFAQNLPVDPETNKVSYSEVIDVPDAKKDELYSRAQSWFAKTYGSSKAVLEIQDKDNGKLFGKALAEVSFKNGPMGTRYGGIMRYTVNLLVKDGKYKYTLTDFYHESGTDNLIAPCGAIENEKKPKGTAMRGLTGQGGFPTQKQWEQIKEDVDGQMKLLSASIRKGMAKGEADF